MDIDPACLDHTVAATEAMLDHNDVEVTIEATTGRHKALKGADYALNMIHVGGREPLENEIRIP